MGFLFILRYFVSDRVEIIGQLMTRQHSQNHLLSMKVAHNDNICMNCIASSQGMRL